MNLFFCFNRISLVAIISSLFTFTSYLHHIITFTSHSLLCSTYHHFHILSYIQHTIISRSNFSPYFNTSSHHVLTDSSPDISRNSKHCLPSISAFITAEVPFSFKPASRRFRYTKDDYKHMLEVGQNQYKEERDGKEEEEKRGKEVCSGMERFIQS